ncbi:MAG: hypothetical protein ACYCS9_11190 [Candidatus Dormibacteria bacterium]
MLTSSGHRLSRFSGLRFWQFHGLRRACALQPVAAGITPRVVVKFLGQCQVSLTLNAYGHVIPNLGREAGDRLDPYLSGSVGPAHPAVR